MCPRPQVFQKVIADERASREQAEAVVAVGVVAALVEEVSRIRDTEVAHYSRSFASPTRQRGRPSLARRAGRLFRLRELRQPFAIPQARERVLHIWMLGDHVLINVEPQPGLVG